MNRFRRLNFRQGYATLGWVIIVVGFLAALQISLSQAYESMIQNILLFALIFGLSAFIGGSMIMLSEVVKIALRIDDHLGAIRNLNETDRPVASVSTPQPEPILQTQQIQATDEMTNLKAKFKGANFNDAMYYYQRGMAHRKAGNLSVAKEDFTKAYDMGIVDPYTEEAKGKSAK